MPTLTNPISNEALMSFSVFQTENICISVYDVTGRVIKNLFDGRLNAGNHQFRWNTNDDVAESGVYFLRITGENFSRYCKLLVVK